MYNGGWGDIYYDYFQFDVSKGVPASAVKQVILQVYSTGASVNNPALQIQRITQDWTEAGVTKNNHPSTVGYGDCGPTSSGWTTCDVTELYKNWVNGTWPNYGIMLAPTNTNHTNGSFAACENGDPTIRPKLVVNP